MSESCLQPYPFALLAHCWSLHQATLPWRFHPIGCCTAAYEPGAPCRGLLWDAWVGRLWKQRQLSYEDKEPSPAKQQPRQPTSFLAGVSASSTTTCFLPPCSVMTSTRLPSAEVESVTGGGSGVPSTGHKLLACAAAPQGLARPDGWAPEGFLCATQVWKLAPAN